MLPVPETYVELRHSTRMMIFTDLSNDKITTTNDCTTARKHN